MARNSIIDQHSNTPFDYTLRVSQKARYARLQIKPYHGLEVVIPPRFPKSAVAGLVQQHADWIRQQLTRHQLQFQKPALPTEIYLTINHSSIEVSASQYHERDYTDSLLKLRSLVRKQAWLLLPPILEQLSTQCGLDYRKISIRSQKTRWGSCSSKGTISLNDQLVFVPESTARYLMIHELCHTRHMNHSKKFWQLVESHCADFRYHESVLNRARRQIPDWYLYSLYR